MWTRLLIVALAATALASCTTSPSSAGLEPVRFVVVRHAEKSTDPADSADPPLTAGGHARAARLAASLAGAPLVAVYATPYVRTQDTARPSADAHGLAVTTYDPRQPADRFVADVQTRHPAGTVLIVGHSNTVPAIASALCGCEVAAMDESEYDHRFLVDIGPGGHARLLDAPLP